MVFEVDLAATLDGYYASKGAAEEVKIGDRSYKAQNPDRADFEIFRDEMVTLVKRQRHPTVADIIARGAPFLWDAVRMVNDTSKQGYKGIAARGAELLINPFSLRDTGSASGFPATGVLSTWVVIRTASGAARSYPSANTCDMLISSLPVLAHVVLGFVNPVAVPKTESVQLIYNDPNAEEVFDWQYRDTPGEDSVAVYELRQPWIIAPGDSYRVNFRYGLTGEDKTQPIAFTVKRAQNINASSAIAS